MTKPCYLYKITNNVNGKIYIGMTSNIKQREYQHFHARHPDNLSIVKLAIDKYGKESFTFGVICVGSKEYIADLEAKAIQAYDTINNGYNIRPGGEGNIGGYSVKERSDDVPTFITGFWFPNLRVGLRATGMLTSTYHDRKRRGVVGEVDSFINRYTPANTPTYVSGMWFPNINVASESLKVAISTLRKRIIEGCVEAKFIEKVYKTKSVFVNGTLYKSIISATKGTGLSYRVIVKNINKGETGFSFYTTPVEELTDG